MLQDEPISLAELNRVAELAEDDYKRVWCPQHSRTVRLGRREIWFEGEVPVGFGYPDLSFCCKDLVVVWVDRQGFGDDEGSPIGDEEAAPIKEAWVKSAVECSDGRWRFKEGRV